MDPTTKPNQTPEGRALEAGRKTVGLSFRAAAALADISESWWRNIESGFQSMGGGWYKPVDDAPADTIARMARAVGVSPDELRGAGREDAARELEHLMTRDAAAIDREAPSDTDEVISAIERHPTLPDAAKRTMIATARIFEEEVLKRVQQDADQASPPGDRREAM